MTKITDFKNADFKAIRNEIHAALKTVEDKYGMKLVMGNIRYDSNQFSSKLVATVNDASTGAAVSKEEAALKSLGKMYLGSDFDIEKIYNHIQLGDFKFIGLNNRARKNPFIVKQLSTGKTFVIPDDVAERIVRATSAAV